MHGDVRRADEVLVWNAQTGENIAERVHDITGGKGAYAAIDAVGGELTQKLVEAVRPRGQTLIYGAMSGLTFTAGIPDVLFHLKVCRMTVMNAFCQLPNQYALLGEMAQALMAVVQRLKLLQSRSRGLAFNISMSNCCI